MTREEPDSFLPWPERDLCGWAPLYSGKFYDETHLYPKYVEMHSSPHPNTNYKRIIFHHRYAGIGLPLLAKTGNCVNSRLGPTKLNLALASELQNSMWCKSKTAAFKFGSTMHYLSNLLSIITYQTLAIYLLIPSRFSSTKWHNETGSRPLF